MEVATRRGQGGDRKAPLSRPQARNPLRKEEINHVLRYNQSPTLSDDSLHPRFGRRPRRPPPDHRHCPRRRIHAPFHPRERTHCIDLRRNGHECRRRPLPRCPGGFPRADAGHRQRRRRHPPKRRKMARRPESNRPLWFFGGRSCCRVARCALAGSALVAGNAPHIRRRSSGTHGRTAQCPWKTRS